MGNLTSSLTIDLVDGVSGKVPKVTAALRKADAQAKAIARTMGSGLSPTFGRQLSGLGLSAREVDKVSDAFRRYARSAGLAEDASKWTKRQAAEVRAWERSTLRSLREVSRSRASAGSGSGGIGASVAGGALGRHGGAGAVGAIGGGYLVSEGLRKATTSALELERTMYRVEKATDTSGEAAKKYERAITDMARETGVGKKQIGDIMASAGFAGRPKEELIDFTRYATQAMSAWETGAEETGQALAELGNIYQANQKRIQEIGDAINSVADNSASKESDLLEFLRRTGSTGKLLGIEAEKMLAFGAAMKEIGVQSEVASTGMNALLGKISEDPEDGFGDQLKQLGIKTKDFTKLVKKDAVQAMMLLLGKINGIEDGAKKMKTLTDIFGKEYADDMAKLAGNLAGVQKQLDFVAQKTNYVGSVQKGYAARLEKDFSKIERATQSIDVLASRVGNSFKIAAGGMAEGINEAVDSIEKGETKLQRLFTRLNAYLDEKEGRKPGELPEIDGGGATAEKWAEENLPGLSGKRWSEAIDDAIGRTPDDARRAGRNAGIAARVEEELRQEGQVDRRRAEVGAELARQQRIAGGAGAGRLTPGQRADAVEKARRASAELQDELEHLNEVRRRASQNAGRAQQRVDETAAQIPPRSGMFGLGGGQGSGGGVEGPGLLNFGFGPRGGTASDVPLPPARPKLDTSEFDAGVNQAKQKLDELGSTTVQPNVSAEQVRALNGALRESLSLIAQVNSGVSGVNQQISRVNTNAGNSNTGKVRSAVSGAF